MSGWDDVRCPNDGEMTNKRCWKCGWRRTGMDDLVTWLRAQMDADEYLFRHWPGDHTERVGTRDGITVASWTPAQGLAEVDAKRRMLNLHEPGDSGPYNRPGPPQCSYCASLCHSRSGLGCDSPDAPWPCDTVRLLALPYAGRPGYQEEWRPA